MNHSLQYNLIRLSASLFNRALGTLAVIACLMSPAFVSSAMGDDWPQWMGPNRDSVWAETGTIDTFPAEGPKVLWRAPIHGGYSGPAVAAGKVFVTDYVSDDFKKQENFERKGLTGTERVLCFDEKTGDLLWKREYERPYSISYPAGPRCTPTVDGDRVYTLGAEGDLLCLDTQDGAVIWSKLFTRDFAAKTTIWGWSSHPLIDGDKLICTVGGEGSLVVAFNKKTGEELYRSGTDTEPGYAPPVIITAGGQRQLIVWSGTKINSMDPETGKLFWDYPLAPRYAMSIMAPRVSGDTLFAGAVFGTCAGLKLDSTKPAATEAWRGPENMKGRGLFPMNMTPFVVDGVMYGCDQPGQFRAVRVSDGEQLWESWKPVTGQEKSRPLFCGTAFLVKNGDKFVLFNELGELIIARLSPTGYTELSRGKVLEPTGVYANRDIVWTHPAFANKKAFVRNDKELVVVDMAAQ